MAGSSLPRFVSDRAITGNPSLCKRLFRQRFTKAKTLHSRNLVGHYGCVNAIEFSNNGGQFLASGGDDRRVLLWNVQEALSLDKKFEVMIGEHHSNIFSLAFDSHNSRIYSGGNDDQVLVHDMQRKDTVDVFLHEDAVYGLAVDPRDSHIFTSACADGRVLLWDTRVPSHQEPIVIATSQTAFYAVVYHPVEPEFIATANSKEGVALWDIRAPGSCLVRYGSTYTQQSAMSVRFNQLGTRLVALRRRLPPVVYDVHSSAAAVQFNHSGYYNSCTMKSCTFAGDKDQYVLSGSDDFNLYMWEVPEPSEDVMWVDEAKLVLQGHRSIVNQVRFNAYTHNIVSSGVEKIIKLWSPFNFPNARSDEDSPRKMFSHQQYIDLVINSGTALSHDYTDQSIEEDPRMIAFFDSLVQREINRSFSDSDDSDMSPESLYLHFAGEGDDSDNSRDTESGSSVSSIHASVISRLMGENTDTSPTSQLRTLWNLSTSSRDQPAASFINEVADDHESNSDSTSDQDSNLPKRAAQQAQNCASTSEVAGPSRQDQSMENGDAQNNPDASETASSKRKRSRHRPSSSTTSPDSSSSDEDVNFQELRAKSRLLRRFLMKKKRKSGTDVDDDQQSSELINNDRFINLKQRMAISRVLKGKIGRPGDRLSRPGVREEDLTRITEHLQQRSMATHQRLAISRMRRRLQQENDVGIGNSLGESSHTGLEPVTNDSLPLPSSLELNHASCSTAQRTTNNDRSLAVPSTQLNIATTSSTALNSECMPSSSSFCGSNMNTKVSNNHSASLNSNGDSSMLAGCSNEASCSNHHSFSSSNHIVPEETNESEQQYDNHHLNEFHKFKNQTARAKRRYRSHKEKKAHEDSDTD
ncbi:DDB1- and CUL4-associated factor 5-like [Patiria miniata]|uniref:DDB1- and CUL4-associated factor 5 n=1 Tax=Patiria miniata TaxID=46514 RepID=A0A914BH18_PATMI|nr:DDB1- and CUL4-associated factor 5-like [Patiria miniata]